MGKLQKKPPIAITLLKTILCTIILLVFVTIFTASKVQDKVITIQNIIIEIPKEEIVVVNVEEPPPLPPKIFVDKPLSERDIINGYVFDISSKYNIDPKLVMSVIEQESKYNPNATNGNCLGLMQISTRWHSDRAAILGVTNFYDPYGNILLGVDYLSELFSKYKDMSLVLMLYSMDHKTALKMYANGEISSYAKTVLARADEYRKGE
jgi:soluble lytic murein transglycosylase-like protein